jgi:hypothetical protein
MSNPTGDERHDAPTRRIRQELDPLCRTSWHDPNLVVGGARSMDVDASLALIAERPKAPSTR